MIKTSKWVDYGVPVALLFVMYGAAIAFRPLLPIDETRYMSVAWEMYLRGDWLAPLTVNFEPYHHKPPLLFWLINMAWSVFGVSRWAGTLPVLFAALACVFLTKKLAEILFPDDERVSRLAPFLLLGTALFLIYSLLVMFDVTLSVFVLASLIALFSFGKTGQMKYLLWLALAMGLGVLTKGPVAWLYVIFPILFGPLWTAGAMKPLKWYGGCVLALLLSTIPVLLWLVPVLSHSSDNFAYWLVWEQTAGRVTGSFGSSHARPVWFYLQFLPVVFLPWLFFPSFWKGLAGMKKTWGAEQGIRFLALFVVPVFIAFSLISGKQTHYLVPLLPGVAIMLAYVMNISLRKVIYTAALLVTILCVGQGATSQTLLKKYDASPMIAYLESHRDYEWAFIGKYHGEFTFLGRLEKTLHEEELGTIRAWFTEHPNGLALFRYKHPEQVEGYEVLFDMPYRGKHLVVFRPKS